MAMGQVIYLADHAAVMTPLVVEAALQRCPVGTEAQRDGYARELHGMGTHDDVDSKTGVANDADRRRFHHIRNELRILGLPLFQQKTIWPRFSDRWDLFWGRTDEPGRDTLLKVPPIDVQAIIAGNSVPYSFIPDLAVRFLLKRRDLEGSGTRNPFIETELMRLATQDPLRLYSRLGTAFYLDVLGSSNEENAARLVGDLMVRGLSGFDGRVIPMVSGAAERFPSAFTPEQMPTLVNLAEKFPILEGEFGKFQNRPELLAAALVACFDEYGKLIVRREVASRIAAALTERDTLKLREKLQGQLSSGWEEPHWQEYAMARCLTRDILGRISALEPPEGEDVSERFGKYSASVLLDLMLYYELDSPDSQAQKNARKIFEVIHLLRDFEPVSGGRLGIFADETLLARSTLLKKLKDFVEHEPKIDLDLSGRKSSEDLS